MICLRVISTSSTFYWTQAGGLRNLKNVLERDFGLGLSGWVLEGVSDISAGGVTIVGSGKNPFGESEGWIARVPVEDGRTGTEP